jgi:hypothetical protein
MKMKIISINRAPTACDRYGLIRRDITDLNLILANIDTIEGCNDCIIACVHALRDLQVAHMPPMWPDGLRCSSTTAELSSRRRARRNRRQIACGGLRYPSSR